MAYTNPRKFIAVKPLTKRIARVVAVTQSVRKARVPNNFLPLPNDVSGKDVLGAWIVDGSWTKLHPSSQARLTDFVNKKLGVHFRAPLLDGSGYAEAGRNYVAALMTAGVAVKATPISFETARSDYGRAGQMSDVAIASTVDHAINITFLTPDHFPLFKEIGKYNIGMFDWETDTLPVEWVEACNSMDEIWVPCRWTANVCRSSGVSRPIYVFGHCASPDDFSNPTPLNLGLDPGIFKFYSIFQWTERKNPHGLLSAYFKAFTASDPVILILKTYRCDYSDAENAVVAAEIERIRASTGRTDLPKIHLIQRMLTKQEILGLHAAGDCFVLLHRSEGWGLPIFEACMMGTPVITTNFGANLEFTKPDNSYLVDASPSHVFGMPWIPWYRDHMKWSDPDIHMGARLMRHVFHNKEEALQKAAKAKKLVHQKFTWRTIGTAMRHRLLEILACEF